MTPFLSFIICQNSQNSGKYLLTDLGRPSRNGKSPGRKTVPWETVAWENACLGNHLLTLPRTNRCPAKIGVWVGLSGITGCSFNLSLTICIKNNGQQKQHPATSSSQSDSDTPTSYPSWVFVLKPPQVGYTFSTFPPESQPPQVGSTFPLIHC